MCIYETHTPCGSNCPEDHKDTKRPRRCLRHLLGEDRNCDHEDAGCKDVRDRLDDQRSVIKEKLEVADGGVWRKIGSEEYIEPILPGTIQQIVTYVSSNRVAQILFGVKIVGAVVRKTVHPVEVRSIEGVLSSF